MGLNSSLSGEASTPICFGMQTPRLQKKPLAVQNVLV